MSTVAERHRILLERIADAGGDPDRITVVAVTKGHPAAVVGQVLDAGIADLGESYAQELAGKVEEVAGHPATRRWHFVGRLQRNKVRMVAPHVALWQSVDRPALAREIARRAPGAHILVQVDLTGEPTKGGCSPARVPELVAAARGLGLEVRGLMGLAAAGDTHSAARQFADLARMADRADLVERSMGMSGDVEQAVRAGATIVRVGTDLVGPRPPRAG